MPGSLAGRIETSEVASSPALLSLLIVGFTAGTRCRRISCLSHHAVPCWVRGLPPRKESVSLRRLSQPPPDALPADDGRRLESKQSGSPAGPQPEQPAQHDPIGSPEPGAWNGSVYDDPLLPEHHVLGSQGCSTDEERPQERQDHPQNAHLRSSVLGRKAGILRLDRMLTQLDKTDLLICDEQGYLSFSRTGAELLFQVSADRYERASLLSTSK